MTARLGSKYRYFGKLVLVPFRYFSIDIYRNIDIFDNTITYCVTWIYFKSIPGSEVVHEFGVRVCPEMFLCRWVGVT